MGLKEASLANADILSFPQGAHSRAPHASILEDQRLLHGVLDNMPQGVSMFNADAKLVFCNRRYIEMYGLSPELTKPGCNFHDVLAERVRARTFSDDPNQHLAELKAKVAAGTTFANVVTLNDGRAFSVVNKPLADGGWVATHEDVTERRRAEQQIAHMARHDALTDLPNRVLLREQLEHELKRVKRGEIIAMLCLDLDHFKSVNDTLGHPIGDELLKLVADRLRGCTREPDTIARLGGDEFAIIMTQLRQPSDAAVLARRIRTSVSRPYQVDGHQIISDISIGISIAPVDGTEPDQLLKNADMALDGAKADGRGTYRFFEAEMDKRMKERRDLEMDLRQALTNGEFELHYQPLVNLQTNEITAFEALLRWHHPAKGLISPADFIPIAEETGLIVSIGEWVLRTACKETANWPDHVKVAVNLSPAQLKTKNLVSIVKTALTDCGMAAERLQLEITETMLMQNTFATLAMLHELRKLGVQIAMDDFGTGYSSLSYLRSFPFDKIKIDRSFVSELTSSNDSLAIVRAVTGLGKSLGIVTTAEGVETAEQLEMLSREGCTQAQGYLISKPRPIAEVEDMLIDRPAIAVA